MNEKKNVFFFVLHILYSHKQQKIPTIPKNNKKKLSLPYLLRKEKLLIVNPPLKIKKILNPGYSGLKNRKKSLQYLS